MGRLSLISYRVLSALCFSAEWYTLLYYYTVKGRFLGMIRQSETAYLPKNMLLHQGKLERIFHCILYTIESCFVIIKYDMRAFPSRSVSRQPFALWTARASRRCLRRQTGCCIGKNRSRGIGVYIRNPQSPGLWGWGKLPPSRYPSVRHKKITRKGADWQMDHIRFEPTSNGDQLQEHAAELLSALDHIFLSVVKLELDTGRAWLLQSRGLGRGRG